ncbi:hypothetical protein FACS189468_0620 [Spirochaetia bacterium]|nr:hypothetical protein FACS189468_0620 [Spirochaetia bacterium]
MRKLFFAGFFNLAILFSAVSAFTQEWGYGVETSSGVLSGNGLFSTYSFSIQGVHDAGFGWSLDYIKGLDVDEWVNGEHYQSSGMAVNSGLLGSVFLGFRLSQYFIPYAGGGLGFKFNDDGALSFGWKVDAGILSWPINRLYVKAGVMYDNIREDLGVSVGVGFKFAKKVTPPAPRPTPAPQPKPTPTPQPTPPPAPPVEQQQAGTVFYQYDGTGYVYLTDNVFYLCTNGRPVGYREGDTIYAFSGKVLGFYANAFIYDIRGNPVGADDPQKLGTDAAARKQASKAPQQDVPAKSPKQSVDKPRLKNGYFGGSLNTVF